MSNDTGTGFGCLCVIVVIFGILYGAYTGLDSLGWVPHHENSVVTAQANWFVGESKDCLSYPLDAQTARTMNKAHGYAISQINCDGGPEHSVNVTFYGRIEQPEYSRIDWSCTRQEDSFTCKQTGNSLAALTNASRGIGCADTEQDVRRETDIWLRRHQDYKKSPTNYRLIIKYLEDHNLCFSQQNVDEAFEALKPTLEH